LENGMRPAKIVEWFMNNYSTADVAETFWTSFWALQNR
jgi:hypothetical protein